MCCCWYISTLHARPTSFFMLLPKGLWPHVSYCCQGCLGWLISGPWAQGQGQDTLSHPPPPPSMQRARSCYLLLFFLKLLKCLYLSRNGRDLTLSCIYALRIWINWISLSDTVLCHIDPRARCFATERPSWTRENAVSLLHVNFMTKWHNLENPLLPILFYFSHKNMYYLGL